MVEVASLTAVRQAREEEKRYAVYAYPWGSAVYDKKADKYTTLFLAPDGQKIDVTHLSVRLHLNGIEFL